ncbi:type II toxin-antitoxin system HipA family toxin [Arcobacter sp. FWKO B]|uniref:type II toxin-antitoxin system HipA family toxin n=1 Tax=Arcobacter sp. FWKO B TaxID=2593672 RepID=UPI0018A53A1A|nr:type II toxin-antitoxin system HipA family toxin [Arcobacter sp. FWKO B]QOG12099.1 type II toxin-antitoxin system HipA family toxin [Arcobacter sp. FWKO B]
MSKIVNVKLWGTHIGVLGYEPGQSEIATFEYDDNFLKMGISPSPLKLPTNSSIYTFDDISKKTFHGLPGFIADSLPDKFGNQLIDQYFASIGKQQSEITALDRLLYVGFRAMGALEFEPSQTLKSRKSNIALDLDSLSQLAQMVLSNKEAFAHKLKQTHRDDAISLLKIGSSAGGARSKALVAIDEDDNIYDGTVEQTNMCKYYILKFDSIDNSDRDNKDPKGMTRIEYIYSLIAKECGIDIANTSYIELGDDFHFLSQRFDRVKKHNSNKLEKLHYVSWCGLSHAHRETTGAYSYEQLIMTARELGLGQDSITELFKRAIFNIIGRNQDDHTKNFGFLMDKSGKWHLAPAFDMTYSYDPKGKWTNMHQIRLNGKQDKFLKDDIISFGKYCNLNEKKSTEILKHTIHNFSQFEQLAPKFNVGKELFNTVRGNLRLDVI